KQPVIGRAQPFIAKNSIGADDPPKPEWGVGIAGIVVRMIRLGGFEECRPQPVGVVLGKRTKQLIKGFHIDPRTKNSSAFPFNNFLLFLSMMIETVAAKAGLCGRKPRWYGRNTTGPSRRHAGDTQPMLIGYKSRLRPCYQPSLNVFNLADMPAAG